VRAPRPVDAIAVVAVLAAAFAGCGEGDRAASDASAQVRGTVVIEPTCPVETVDQDCSPHPVAATVDVFEDSAGAGEPSTDPARSVEAEDDGRFEIELAAGNYLLSARTSDALAQGVPQEVTLRPKEEVEVTLTIDSGIR